MGRICLLQIGKMKKVGFSDPLSKNSLKFGHSLVQWKMQREPSGLSWCYMMGMLGTLDKRPFYCSLVTTITKEFAAKPKISSGIHQTSDSLQAGHDLVVRLWYHIQLLSTLYKSVFYRIYNTYIILKMYITRYKDCWHNAVWGIQNKIQCYHFQVVAKLNKCNK